MKSKNNKRKLEKLYRLAIYILPVALFFSYQPLIKLGSGETMNFELSLPLMWLVGFDMLAFVIMIGRKMLKTIISKWVWLLFPGLLTISLLWTHDIVRGILTVGIVWLIYFAIFAFISLKRYIIGEKFQRSFFRIFFAVGIMVCIWCLLQCILDVVGVSQSCTLMCDGCVYSVFGFPHPNGFAAEPQFMGNLLLAPAIVSLYLAIKNKFFSRKSLLAMFFVFVVTLFLTLSRGAIYAFVVALMLFTVMWGIKTRKWRVMLVWPMVLIALLVALNMQGIFAEVSKTNDTYVSGVSKAVNQLSLGMIDLGGSQVKKNSEKNEEEDVTRGSSEKKEEKKVEIEDEEKNESESARFDGYVEVSTSERVNSWEGAFTIWSKDFSTMMFGVGIGGAPIARYENGLFLTPKEIINNEYVSLLLETGLVGVALLMLTIVLIVRAMRKSVVMPMTLTLMVAYGVTLMFFSGLPNALHIYLLPAVLWVFPWGEKSGKKGLTKK